MPTIYIIAGCNGAGKTTAAKTLLPEVFGISEFVNADSIAAGLSPFNPEGVVFQAGRLMLERMHALAAQKADFAFETTLATRSYAPRMATWIKQGYTCVLIFFYLPDPALAVNRIAERVRLGGHHVPDEIVFRRYERGLRNFFTMYKPLAGSWYFMDNAVSPFLIASGSKHVDSEVKNTDIWNKLKAFYDRN